jgi:hypothetical protein
MDLFFFIFNQTCFVGILASMELSMQSTHYIPRSSFPYYHLTTLQSRRQSHPPPWDDEAHANKASLIKNEEKQLHIGIPFPMVMFYKCHY